MADLESSSFINDSDDVIYKTSPTNDGSVLLFDFGEFLASINDTVRGVVYGY